MVVFVITMSTHNTILGNPVQSLLSTIGHFGVPIKPRRVGWVVLDIDPVAFPQALSLERNYFTGRLKRQRDHGWLDFQR